MFPILQLPNPASTASTISTNVLADVVAVGYMAVPLNTNMDQSYQSIIVCISHGRKELMRIPTKFRFGGSRPALLLLRSTPPHHPPATTPQRSSPAFWAGKNVWPGKLLRAILLQKCTREAPLNSEDGFDPTNSTVRKKMQALLAELIDLLWLGIVYMIWLYDHADSLDKVPWRASICNPQLHYRVWQKKDWPRCMHRWDTAISISMKGVLRRANWQ